MSAKSRSEVVCQASARPASATTVPATASTVRVVHIRRAVRCRLSGCFGSAIGWMMSAIAPAAWFRRSIGSSALPAPDGRMAIDESEQIVLVVSDGRLVHAAKMPDQPAPQAADEFTVLLAVASNARSHSVSAPIERLLRLAEPTRRNPSSTIMTLL